MKNKFAKILGTCLTVVTVISSTMTAAPVLADVSAPTVSVSPTTISNNSTYTITFNTTRQLSTGGNITIAFPSDTQIQTGNVTNNVSVTTSTGTNSTANINGLDASGDNATRTLVVKLNSANVQIRADSQVTVVLGSQIIKNPYKPGNYSLNVSTSNETTPVASAGYSITLPSLGPKIPPFVIGKNAAGEIIFNNGTWDLNEVINTPNVTRIEVGLGGGGFNTTINANVSGQTIIATGSGDLFYVPPGALVLSMSADNVTIIGFKIHGDSSATANAVLVTGRNNAIQNCTFERRISSNGSLILSGCYFTGNGSGISVTNGTAAISNSIFPAMSDNALLVSGGNVTVTGCTFTGSAQNVSAANGVISVSGGMVFLAGNVIAPAADSNFVFHISGGTVTARYNSLSNAMVVRQTAGTADFVRNWWGTNTGPEQSTVNGTISFTPFLNRPVTGGRIALNSANFSTAASALGVDIISTNATNGSPLSAGVIAAARYYSNPLSDFPLLVSTLGFYDIDVSQPAAGSTITIKLFNSEVTSESRIFYAGQNGDWTQLSQQGVVVTNGYAYTTLTETSTPPVKDLTGMAFALVNRVRATSGAIPIPPSPPDLLSPAAGAKGAPLGPIFRWSQIAGAVYDFQLSTSTDFWPLTAKVYNLTETTYVNGILLGDTTYYWRIRATTGNRTSPWVTAAFTTGPLIIPSSIAISPMMGPTPPPPPRYNLTLNTTGIGRAEGGGTYNGGDSVAITALPDPGWRFVNWTGSTVENSSASNTTVIMYGDKAVTAHFELITTSNAVQKCGTWGPNQYLWLFIITSAAVIIISVLLALTRKKSP